MKGKIPELLAPAGGPEAFRAAVIAGADAVYLGGSSYSARHYAGNFSPEEMEDAVGYAHLRNVKVYVTVNTVIKDRELPDVIEYLLFLYSIGVDAVLIQDIGLSALTRSVIPGLRLHASTQMTIHNLAGAVYAESLGFERIVLARELTAGEVAGISECLKNTGVEIFVHGALCFCYSGDCLLSAMIGGRSGNRGMCAQPCRKNYRLTETIRDKYGRVRAGRELCRGYLMSMKDLCLYDVIDKAASGTIDSLKIEGRMKSQEYVAVVTDVYRRALDSLSGDGFRPSDEDASMLALAFNREFTQGYFRGFHDGDVISPDRPGNRGLLIGKVVGYDIRSGMAEINTESNFSPFKGEGLMFLAPGFEEGMILRHDPVKIGSRMGLKTGMKIPAGASVYITGSRRVVDRAKEIVASGEGRRSIPVNLAFRINDDGKAVLCGRFRLSGGEILSLESISDFRMETAIKRPLNPDQARDQLTKTGGTVFEVEDLDMDLPDNLFTPISNLNRLRRTLFEMAEEAIIQASHPDNLDLGDCRNRISGFRSLMKGVNANLVKGGITGLSCYTDSIEMFEAAVRGGADTIYFEIQGIDLHPPGEITDILSSAADTCDRNSVQLYWKLPDIIRQEMLERVLLVMENLPEGIGIMTGDPGASHMIRMENPDINIAGSAYLNVCNHLTVNTLSAIFDRLTLSPELSYGDIRDIAVHLAGRNTPSLELLVQGNIEVMISENSIVSIAGESPGKDQVNNYGILDESGRLFPVAIDSSGRTHIRNADELCLFDLLPEIYGIGPLSVTVDARDRTPEYAEEILQLYKRGINSVNDSKGGISGGISLLMDSVRQISGKRITTGFFRKE